MELEFTGNPEIPGEMAMRRAMQAYVDCTNAGDAAGIVALFAPNATIEDPVGTAVKSGDAISRWFADAVAFETLITPVAPIRASFADEAALAFEVSFTPTGEKRMTIRSLDVCRFDAKGRIISLRAFWGPGDIVK